MILFFSYYEYVGTDYNMDMEKMAANPMVQKWWKITDAFQVQLETRKEGEWWETMEDVFHQE